MEAQNPYPLTTREIAEWSLSRSAAHDASPGSKTAVYHTPDRPRLPGWSPSVTNVVLLARLIDQPGGREVAENLEVAMRHVVGRLPLQTQRKLFVVPAEQLHMTIGYLGLNDLTDMNAAFPVEPSRTNERQTRANGEQSRNWKSVLRSLARKYAAEIKQFGDTTSQLQPFSIHFRGVQAVPNSLLFRAMGGGEQVNVATAALRSSVPTMKGNDPFIGPQGKNAEGSWGMAAHVTGALVAESFDSRLAGYLMHTAGRGIIGDEVLEVDTIALVAQTYGVARDSRGQQIGTPFEQDPIHLFTLGRSAERSDLSDGLAS